MSENGFSGSYKEAGVDVTAGYKAVELMKKHVLRTKTPGVLEGLGGFGGLYALPKNMEADSVLVSGTDGVGTKIQVAKIMDKHDTIGIDCVAMCVNDIVCVGAGPMFFLDYIAIGKNIPEKIESIVAGVAEGCVQAGCALIGGETAEHPGVMPEDEYDLAGFSVGIVSRSKMLDKESVSQGDVIIGLASSGVHSNGFSLIRKVFDINKDNLNRHYPELGKTLGEELLTPTRIYVYAIQRLLETVNVHSISHITGGGFYENIPRAIPEGCGAVIERDRLEIPPVFDLIAKTGNIPERDMFGTFNMGTGMCVIVSARDALKAMSALNGCGVRAGVIGEVKKGVDGVELA